MRRNRAVRDFRTDYLMKVFDYNAQAQTSRRRRWRTRSIASGCLPMKISRRDFKAWLLDPEHFAELDRGTILIPEKFLAKGAVAPTPVGFAPRTCSRPSAWCRARRRRRIRCSAKATSSRRLKKAAERGIALQNIRSVAGFERRLNDMSCAGCHQTRGIGGFHFPGVDWMAAKPSNSTVVPASPHFFGDQVRRRDILTALRDGKRPDYLARLLQPSAIARQHRTRRHRI